MLWSFEPVRRLKLFETSNKVLNTPLRAINNSDSSLCFNKPRVFGLHVGCKKLDILKILAIFWWIVLKLFGFFCKLWGNFFIFFLKFSGNFPKGYFWRIFLAEFFWRNFLGEIFWEEFSVRNSLFTLELTCLSRFWFLSRFCLNGEEGRRTNFRSLEVRVQAHCT